MKKYYFRIWLLLNTRFSLNCNATTLLMPLHIHLEKYNIN